MSKQYFLPGGIVKGGTGSSPLTFGAILTIVADKVNIKIKLFSTSLDVDDEQEAEINNFLDLARVAFFISL